MGSILPLTSSRELIKILGGFGFEHNRTRGDHHVLVQRSTGRVCVVPERRELPRGTLRSILQQTGVSQDELLKAMGR
ncbi:MAG TPA: type II toxin-antitoxin system HicA family toxin [Phycisphaerales bacterium]